MRTTLLASGVYRASKLFNKAWAGHQAALEELVLLLGTDAFFRAYNEVAYRSASSYDPRSLRFNSQLFDWEVEAIESLFPAPPARVLVGGAGGGREAFALCDRGYRVTAFEPVAKLAAALFETAETRGLALEVFAGGYEQLGNGGCEEDASQTPPRLSRSKLGAFDVIVLGWASLTHLRSARARRLLLRHCHELLSPEGRLLASYLVRRTKPTERTPPLRAALGQARKVLRGLGHSGEADRFFAHVGYAHQFDDDELRRLAADAGLKIVAMHNGEADEYPHCVMERPG